MIRPPVARCHRSGGGPHCLGYVVAPLLGMILYDFFGYWLHRAQHKWLWRLHAIHHAIEELSGINSYFHPTEQFFSGSRSSVSRPLISWALTALRTSLRSS